MSDDWRLRVKLREHGHARKLLERLEASRLARELEVAFADRIVVSRDGAEVFCYAGARVPAEQAATAIQALASEHGWKIDCELARWHPAAAEWEDPQEPLPSSEAERASEHARLIAHERAELLYQGYPDFEVRVECPTSADAERLAAELERDEVATVRRFRYLLIGAADEDAANAIAERLRAQAPQGSEVSVEGTAAAAESELPPNPFAVFGGIGG